MGDDDRRGPGSEASLVGGSVEKLHAQRSWQRRNPTHTVVKQVVINVDALDVRGGVLVGGERTGRTRATSEVDNDGRLLRHEHVERRVKLGPEHRGLVNQKLCVARIISVCRGRVERRVFVAAKQKIHVYIHRLCPNARGSEKHNGGNGH
jgi:hypothetical protein